VDITRQIMADTTSTVCRIQIVGMASVEGAVARNEKLAGARADALKRYIQERVQMPDSYFEVANGGEAWADFRSQIVELMDNTTNADTIKALQRAIRIIDTENDLNYREVCLRRLAGGSTYAYIKKHLLPDQRNSGYLRIYYDYVPDANAPVINRATELLQQKRYSEALPLLRSVQGDSRSWNALGVALWHTGDHAAAQNYFKIAAQQGNADAKQNLKALTK
jgi:tetratricopeptide (TPR) repeat protein